MMTYDVPVLFIIFKRGYTAEKVFQRIREIRPSKLYVAADGPRNEEEKVLCERTRKLIEQVDWVCDLKVRFREENLGCKYGPYDSISWFFQHETEGVILEDDCVPDLSFFPFVREMLERYREDNRVGMIAGHNEVNTPCETSYLFSRFKACWGWATWKRAWDLMDLELVQYDYRTEIVPLMVYHREREAHWRTALDLIDADQVAAWDWPWYFSLAAESMLCIFPARNLIANIGFGEDGTHCLGEAPESALTSFSLDFPLKHPRTMAVNWTFEQAFEQGLRMGMPVEQVKKKHFFQRWFRKKAQGGK